jgi:hypothetical protein
METRLPSLAIRSARDTTRCAPVVIPALASVPAVVLLARDTARHRCRTSHLTCHHRMKYEPVACPFQDALDSIKLFRDSIADASLSRRQHFLESSYHVRTARMSHT